VRNQDIGSKRKQQQQQQRYNTSCKENSALANLYAMFLYALNSSVTREIFYKIAIFFAKIGLTDHDIDNNHFEELCRTFVEKGNSNKPESNNNTRRVSIEGTCSGVDRMEEPGNAHSSGILQFSAVASSSTP
jgi:hypothetical protein